MWAGGTTAPGDNVGGSPSQAFRMLTGVMLVRVRPAGYQVDLWRFFENSALGTVERVGRDAVRISDDADPNRVAEALALWQGRNASAEADIVPGA
jgi:hypothetical protein